MIKRLKRRLILIFTFFTSLVLVLVLAFSMWNALEQNTKTHLAAFEAENELILSGIAGGNANTDWLDAMEQEKGIVLRVEKNGQTITHSEIQEYWSGLLNKVDELLKSSSSHITDFTLNNENAESKNAQEPFNTTSNYGYTTSPLTSSIETVQDANGTQYWVLATMVILGENGLPIDNSDVYSVTVLKNSTEMNRQAMWIVLSYLGLLLLGILILALVNRFLTGLVLKPTQESIQQQTEFVAAASHELRNPLAVVRNSAHAGRKAKTAQDAVKYFDLVDAEATRMSRLVDDLLILAGSESGRWHIQESTVDLDPLLIEASDTLGALGKKKGVALVLELPDEPLGKIRGDADRMMQVLRILADNAIGYSHDGGVVELRASKTRGGVTLQVADHGPGVAVEDKPRVFDRFYRSDKSRSDKEHFGLGLSVARELVEMHGGKLSLEDTPGGGATFTVYLQAQHFV